MSETESTNEKDARNEREAADIFGRVYETDNVDKVDAYSNTDPLGFIDVFAAKDPWPVRFVQVKTNRFSAAKKREYVKRVGWFDESVCAEVWVRVGREGWQIHEFDSENGMWNCYLKMDTCNYDETVEAFREAVGFYGGDA